METEKLMQSNENGNVTLNMDSKMANGDGGNGDCPAGEKVNGGSELTKPELIEMSTSTTSVKCCNGFLKSKEKQKKMLSEASGNGTTGKCYFNTLKARLSSSNGKYKINGDVNENGDGKKREKKTKGCVFDDRDPFKVNSNVKFEFLNVFAEPNSGTYSFNPIWSFTSRMYFNLKLFLYRLLAIIIGIPCAFICAIVFALFSAFQIWIFMPILRMFKAIFGLIKEIWTVIIDTIFGPIIQLFIRHRTYGPDSQCPSSVSSKSIYNEDVNVV